jgi:hypothetical protein
MCGEKSKWLGQLWEMFKCLKKCLKDGQNLGVFL